MLRPDGYVKVLDFGIAKFTQQDSVGLEKRTQPGMILGTTRYMSPEQARGQTVDARTDLWSLGVVLYEMLTGCPPFEGQAPADVTTAVLMKETPSLAERTPNLPAKLQGIVEKTLQKEKDERCESAGELLNDLREVKHEVDLEEKIGTSRTGTITSASNFKAQIVEERKGRKKSALIALVGVLLVALGGIGYFTFAQSEIAAIAVLPFENATGGADAEYLVDGITDSLIDSLWRVRKLRVMARGTVFGYKGRPMDARAVGRELKVDAVLTGSVMRSGERVRIAVRLIHAATGRNLWTNSYERELRDGLALQREMTRDIVGEIRIKLTPQEQGQFGGASVRSTRKPTITICADGFISTAKTEKIMRPPSGLERAVATDPNFAAAYAELAQAYVWKLFLFAPEERQLEEKAFMAAEKALALDPNLAVAHLARGRLLWTPANHFPHEKAIREYRRALDIEPESG